MTIRPRAKRGNCPEYRALVMLALSCSGSAVHEALSVPFPIANCAGSLMDEHSHSIVPLGWTPLFA